MSWSGDTGYPDVNEQLLGLDATGREEDDEDGPGLCRPFFNSVLLLALCGEETLLSPLGENLKETGMPQQAGDS